MSKPSVLILDNNDSFTWNLHQLVQKAGGIPTVLPTYAVQKSEILKFSAVIISPGPGLPEEMPGLMELTTYIIQEKPLLGVCLGHQAIAKSLGGKLNQLDNIIHGNSVNLMCIGKESQLLEGVPENCRIGLYHSWAVDLKSLPENIEIIAVSCDNIIMAFQHKNLPVYGLQFHPESYITNCGLRIMENFLKITKTQGEI